MRLFIALELPVAVKRELTVAQERLPGGAVRWISGPSMHLTLQFLGEVEEGWVTPLLDALNALPRRPFPLQLAGLGGFPTSRQPRVVWAGVGGDTGALRLLHGVVIGATSTLGCEPEARAFVPHLTLGRARPGARPEQLRALGDALSRAEPPAPLKWEAGAPILFKSTLTPQGAIYEALGP